MLTAVGATAATLSVSRDGWAEDPESPHYALKEIVLGGDKRIGTRFTLLTPKHTGKKKVPLLVALHGLGETHDQRIGARAWVDRYGLGSSYDRLRTPPVKPLHKWRHWTKERLAEVNASLKKTPLHGIAVACPFTPNVGKSPLGRKAALDKYADWIVDTVIPRARKEGRIHDSWEQTYIDGCSLGGYISIEVFLRKPEAFCAWGAVQGALGTHRIHKYAADLKAVIDKHGPRRLHIETSKGDAFRKVNEAFSKALTKKKVAHDFIMPPGPHNQPFLRDSGTIEMLLWHDRIAPPSKGR